MSRLYIFLFTLLFFSCERSQTNLKSRVYTGKLVTLKYTGEIVNGDWLRVDTILFIHKKDFDPETDGNVLRDSLNFTGKRIYFFTIPASKRVFQIDGKKSVEESIPASGILAAVVNILGTLNSKSPMYRANIGANLWLNNSLTILPADNEKRICIEVPLSYKAIIGIKE